MNKKINYIQENFKKLKNYKKKNIFKQTKDKFRIIKAANKESFQTKIFRNNEQIKNLNSFVLNVSTGQVQLEYTTLNLKVYEKKINIVFLNELELNLKFENYNIFSKTNGVGIHKIFVIEYQGSQIEKLKNFELSISIEDGANLNLGLIPT